jgi:hypothetical protein
MSIMAKTHKTGKTKIHKGKLINEYSDGCYRYDGSGALAIRSPKWANFTKENTREMQVRGQDAKRAKKQEAIRKAVEDISGLPMNLSGDAIAYIAGELVKETLQHDNPLRDRVYTYKEVGGDAGLVDGRVGGGGTQAIQVNINISEKATAGIEEEDQILDAIYADISRKE